MRVLLVFLVVLLSFSYANTWTFEVSTGNSYKIPNTLTVYQRGLEHTIENARYETRPWTSAACPICLTENYYTVRIGYSPATETRWSVSYELELVHDKAYLIDTDGVVQHMEWTDGFNNIFFNVALVYPYTENLHFVARTGAGIFYPNPASVVRGLHLGTRTHLDPESSYYFSGLNAQVAGQVRYYLNDWFALTTEARYIFTYSEAPFGTPISHGLIRGNFNAFHINVGVLFQTR